MCVWSSPALCSNSLWSVGGSSGRFGACFLPALCKQSDLQVLAARPGLRLWRADVRGHVDQTRLLKTLFSQQVEEEEEEEQKDKKNWRSCSCLSTHPRRPLVAEPLCVHLPGASAGGVSSGGASWGVPPPGGPVGAAQLLPARRLVGQLERVQRLRPGLGQRGRRTLTACTCSSWVPGQSGDSARPSSRCWLEPWRAVETSCRCPAATTRSSS